MRRSHVGRIKFCSCPTRHSVFLVLNGNSKAATSAEEQAPPCGRAAEIDYIDKHHPLHLHQHRHRPSPCCHRRNKKNSITNDTHHQCKDREKEEGDSEMVYSSCGRLEGLVPRRGAEVVRAVPCPTPHSNSHPQMVRRGGGGGQRYSSRHDVSVMTAMSWRKTATTAATIVTPITVQHRCFTTANGYEHNPSSTCTNDGNEDSHHSSSARDPSDICGVVQRTLSLRLAEARDLATRRAIAISKGSDIELASSQERSSNLHNNNSINNKTTSINSSGDAFERQYSGDGATTTADDRASDIARKIESLFISRSADNEGPDDERIGAAERALRASLLAPKTQAQRRLSALRKRSHKASAVESRIPIPTIPFTPFVCVASSHTPSTAVAVEDSPTTGNNTHPRKAVECPAKESNSSFSEKKGFPMMGKRNNGPVSKDTRVEFFVPNHASITFGPFAKMRFTTNNVWNAPSFRGDEGRLRSVAFSSSVSPPPPPRSIVNTRKQLLPTRHHTSTSDSLLQDGHSQEDAALDNTNKNDNDGNDDHGVAAMLLSLAERSMEVRSHLMRGGVDEVTLMQMVTESKRESHSLFDDDEGDAVDCLKNSCGPRPAHQEPLGSRLAKHALVLGHTRSLGATDGEQMPSSAVSTTPDVSAMQSKLAALRVYNHSVREGFAYEIKESPSATERRQVEAHATQTEGLRGEANTNTHVVAEALPPSSSSSLSPLATVLASNLRSFGAMDPSAPQIVGLADERAVGRRLVKIGGEGDGPTEREESSASSRSSSAAERLYASKVRPLSVTSSFSLSDYALPQTQHYDFFSENGIPHPSSDKRRQQVGAKQHIANEDKGRFDFKVVDESSVEEGPSLSPSSSPPYINLSQGHPTRGEVGGRGGGSFDRDTPIPALLIETTTHIDLVPWVADHLAALKPVCSEYGDPTPTLSSDTVSSLPEIDGESEEGLRGAAGLGVSTLSTVSRPPSAMFALDCHSVYVFLSKHITPSILSFANLMREQYEADRKRQFELQRRRLVHTACTVTKNAHHAHTTAETPTDMPPEEEVHVGITDEEVWASMPPPTPHDLLPITGPLVEFIATILQSAYPSFVSHTLLAEKVQYGRNTAEDEALEGVVGDPNGNSKQHIRNIAFRKIRPERSRVKAELLRNDPLPPADAQQANNGTREDDDDAQQQQAQSSGQRLVVEDHSVPEVALYYKSRVVALASAEAAVRKANSAGRTRGSSNAAFKGNSVIDGNTEGSAFSSAPSKAKEGYREELFRFASSVGPLLEAYRTIHRAVTERDFLIAVSARSWAWRESLRRILVRDLSGLLLEQRLFSAAIIYGELRHSPAASPASSLNNLPNPTAATVSDLLMMSCEDVAAIHVQREAAVAGSQTLDFSGPITPAVAAALVNPYSRRSMHTSSDSQLKPTKEEPQEVNLRDQDSDTQNFGLPSFSHSLAELATHSAFRPVDARSVVAPVGLPYAGGSAQSSNGQIATPLASPLSDAAQHVLREALAKDPPSALAPFPNVPPMPKISGSALMPTTKPRPYPNTFADRTHAMEVARQLAHEKAEKEWEHLMSRRRQRAAKERMLAARSKGRRGGADGSRVASSLSSPLWTQSPHVNTDSGGRRLAMDDRHGADDGGVEDYEGSFSQLEPNDNNNNNSNNKRKSLKNVLSSLLAPPHDASVSRGDAMIDAVLTPEVMEALATLETLDSLNEADCETLSSSELVGRQTSSSGRGDARVGGGQTVSGQYTPAVSAAWRAAAMTDSDETYANIMRKMPQTLIAAKVRAAQRRLEKRVGRARGGGDRDPSHTYSAELKALEERVATDPSLAEAAVSTFASPVTVSKMVEEVLNAEETRRARLIRNRVRVLEDRKLAELKNRLAELEVASSSPSTSSSPHLQGEESGDARDGHSVATTASKDSVEVGDGYHESHSRTDNEASRLTFSPHTDSSTTPFSFKRPSYPPRSAESVANNMEVGEATPPTCTSTKGTVADKELFTPRSFLTTSARGVKRAEERRQPKPSDPSDILEEFRQRIMLAGKPSNPAGLGEHHASGVGELFPSLSQGPYSSSNFLTRPQRSASTRSAHEPPSDAVDGIDGFKRHECSPSEAVLLAFGGNRSLPNSNVSSSSLLGTFDERYRVVAERLSRSANPSQPE